MINIGDDIKFLIQKSIFNNVFFYDYPIWNAKSNIEIYIGYITINFYLYEGFERDQFDLYRIITSAF